MLESGYPSVLKEDEEKFLSKSQRREEKVLPIEKFGKFLAGIQENNNNTSQSKCMISLQKK